MAKKQFDKLRLLKEFYVNELFPFVSSRPELVALDSNIGHCIDFRRTMVIPVIDSLQELDLEEDTELWTAVGGFVDFVLYRFLDVSTCRQNSQNKTTISFKNMFELKAVSSFFFLVSQCEKTALKSDLQHELNIWIYRTQNNEAGYLNHINAALQDCIQALIGYPSRNNDLYDIKFKLETYYDKFIKELPVLMKNEHEDKLTKLEQAYSRAMAAVNQIELLERPEHQRIDLLTFYRVVAGLIKPMKTQPKESENEL